MSDRRVRAVQTPHVLDFISHSAAQTTRVGQRLGELLRRGDIVALLGDFGSGKTQLIKGIAQGLGSADPVTSPSFVLVNEYRAGPQHRGMPIYHADLYRIEDPAELAGIGLDDLLEGDGVVLIEWAERAAAWLPVEHLTLRLQHLSETKRVLRVEPHGRRYEELADALRRSAFA